MKLKTKIAAFLVFLICAAFVVMARSAWQKDEPNSRQSRPLQKADEDFYTIADYSLSESTDPQLRALRKTRAKRFNMEVQKGVDPARFTLTEERESSFGGPPSHAAIEPALPAAQSDAVVVGEVIDAKAFLTDDRTGVFSEFTIRVSNVLKNYSTAPVFPPDLLTAVRGGGGIRFPSGKVIRNGHHGKPLPRVGRTYLFFLSSNKDAGSDFATVTAYEIRDGRIFPLDGINLAGAIEEAYKEYQKYREANAESFLSEALHAIGRNLGGKSQRGRPIR